ncbi:MAG: hypothetical protein FJ095_04900 [Deltaproteobacteria bacterium]|nr:hypothetical protein [Deltaproteobacteria bacterium]
MIFVKSLPSVSARLRSYASPRSASARSSPASTASAACAKARIPPASQRTPAGRAREGEVVDLDHLVGSRRVGERLVDEVEGVRTAASNAHLATLVDEGSGEFLRIVAATGQRLVPDRREVSARHEAVLRKFGVPTDRSPDLVRRSAPCGLPRAIASYALASARELGRDGC